MYTETTTQTRAPFQERKKEMANQLYGICSWCKSKSISSLKKKKKKKLMQKKLNKESRSLYKMRRRSQRLLCVCVCVHQFFGCHQKYANGMLINQKCLKCWIQAKTTYKSLANKKKCADSVCDHHQVQTHRTKNIQSPCAQMKICQNKRIPRRDRNKNMTWDCDVHTKPCEN